MRAWLQRGSQNNKKGPFGAGKGPLSWALGETRTPNLLIPRYPCGGGHAHFHPQMRDPARYQNDSALVQSRPAAGDHEGIEPSGEGESV